MVSTMGILNLDTRMSIEKALMVLIFDINGNGFYTAVALIDWDMTVLFHIIVLVFEI